ncbi:hypothetical protein GCM10023310_35090 [Paenibacillus vulneris]|uniref:Uncharacterized protein n=1 Tax=Paenibacillus vulneris TaxID=1133364 RepID=A0ABW3UW69_9BACL
MVSKSLVTKAASAAAVMSVIAVPSAVMAAPAVVLHPIQDMTIAQGTETTIYLNDYLSNLSSYKVTSQSVSGVVYATYSYSGQNPLSLRGDQVGSSMVTISDDSGKLEEFKVHVLDAGADKRIDIGDVTKYIAAHASEVTQAADVRTLLNGIEPLYKTGSTVKPTPGVNGKPNAVVLIAGQVQSQMLPVASYFTKTAEESLSFAVKSSYSYIEAAIDPAGVLTLTGTSALGQYAGTTAEIQVTATNQYGNSATLNVPVMIQSVETTYTIEVPDNITMPFTVQLSPMFADIAANHFEIMQAPGNGLIATIADNESTNASIVFSGKAADTVLKLKGTNMATGVSKDVTVQVQVQVNHNPVPVIIGLPDPIQWKIGWSEPQSVSMAAYFATEPGSPLKFTLKKPDYMDAAIDENDGTLMIYNVNPASFLPNPPILQITATNTYKNSATINLPVVIEYPAPKVMGSPDPIQWFMGVTEFKTVNVSEYFWDTTGEVPSLTYSIESMSPSITASINKGSGKLVIQGMQAVTDGSEMIQVKATNKFGKSALLNIKVDVLSSYTLHWKKDDPQNYPNPYAVQLSSIFDGTGATDFELTSLPEGSHMTVGIEGNQTDQAQLVFGETIGDAQFTVIGRNPANGTSKEINIRFVTDYAAPTVKSYDGDKISVTNGMMEGEGQRVYLNKYFSDDSGLLSYTVEEDASTAGEVYTWIYGGEGPSIEFYGANYPENVDTSAVVKVKGTNRYGKSAVLEVPVMIKAAPAPTVIGVPGPNSYTDGLLSKRFEFLHLGSYFSGSRLQIQLENKDELHTNYHASASMDGQDLFVDIQAPLGNTETVTFYVKVRATDSFNRSALMEIPITVKPNAAPIVDPNGIDTIYLDDQGGQTNLIDLDLLSLFYDADVKTDSTQGDSDKLSYTSAEATGSLSGSITSDHYLALSGSSIDTGANVKVTAQDKAGHVISKTLSVKPSPLGDYNVHHVNYNQVMTVLYPDSILPPVTDDKAKAIYLVDLNNPNPNLTYDAFYNPNNNYVIMNGSSLTYPAIINLHYVNKVDHTLTLDVFPVILSV